MGKQNTSMKIQWNGTTGGVVGYSIRGHHYTRSLADNVRNPRTEAQQEARAKFAYVSQLIHDFGGIHLTGYRHYNVDINQRANFSQNLYHSAVSGNRTDGYTVDWTKVMVSKGNLAKLYQITASVAAATQTVSLSWNDNSGVGDALPTDRLLVCVFNVTKRLAIVRESLAARSAESAEVSYPSDWGGDTLYVYAGLTNGTAESQSVCMGPYTA